MPDGQQNTAAAMTAAEPSNSTSDPQASAGTPVEQMSGEESARLKRR